MREGSDIETTEEDVALDLVAALDMYAGTMGGDGVVIEDVQSHEQGAVLLTLDNGDTYRIQVREVRS